jgi:hypothetical protein
LFYILLQLRKDNLQRKFLRDFRAIQNVIHNFKKTSYNNYIFYDLSISLSNKEKSYVLDIQLSNGTKKKNYSEK